MTFKDQHVVIVGGSSGMGLALAQTVLDKGGKVTIAGRSEAKLSAANATLGNRAQILAFDAGNAAAAEKAYASLGPINHLVTTAAALTYAPISEIALDAVAEMLSGKFWAPFLAARFAAPKIVAGGSITFFSGLAAYRPGPGTVAVAALNAGLEGMAKALAVELAPLRVNVLSPGVVETPGWSFLSEDDRKGFFAGQAKSLLTRYVGTSADIAQAAVTLMTNPYITGTVLDVDGGGRLV